jgi:hypothetical protein
MDVRLDTSVFKRMSMHFESLQARMQGNASLEMQEAYGKVILKKAKELVPVRTGALKNSGRVVKTKSRKNYAVRFGNNRVRYAQVVEFGRIQFAPFPPRLYLTRAVRYAKRNAKGPIEAALSRGVKKSLPRRM